MNKSVLWIIIVVILFVVLGVIFLGGSNKGDENITPTSTTSGDNQNSATTTNPQSNLDNLPPATGNVSDIIASILNEATGVSSLPDQTDPSLTQVGNEVNNFDQSSDVQF